MRSPHDLLVRDGGASDPPKPIYTVLQYGLYKFVRFADGDGRHEREPTFGRNRVVGLEEICHSPGPTRIGFWF
jgi:hypothetical protein